MKFKVNKGPFIRNKRTTTSIMLELFAVLMVIFATSIAFYTAQLLLMLVGMRNYISQDFLRVIVLLHV